jgi:hypothetical protein
MATKLLARAARESEKAKLASLPALRRAAGKLARAVAVLLQVAEDGDGRDVSLALAWDEIERVIPRCELTRSSAVTGCWPGSLTARLWRAPGGGWCSQVPSCRRAWPIIVRTSFCVLEALHRGLRRREIDVEGADRWGDPRARLLDGERWETARPRVLEALRLPVDPDSHLQALAVTLDDAYRQVASELAAANRQAVIENGKIRLDRLGAAPEPPGLVQARAEMQRMMPRVDLPDVLLEIFARTGVVDCFTHISGTTTRMDELEASLCAVLLAEGCNIGLRPFPGALRPELP